MAVSIPILRDNFKAYATMATNRGCAVYQYPAGYMSVCSVRGQKASGILDDNPGASVYGAVMKLGLCGALAGGTVAEGDLLTTDENGALITAVNAGEQIVAQARESAVVGDIFTVFVCPGGPYADVEDHSTHQEVFEDFMGAMAPADQGSPGTSPWVIKDTSSSGSPTKAVASGDGGRLTLTFASTNEAENLCLYLNDMLNFDIDKEPIAKCRFLIPALDTNDQVAFGLASARNDAIDSITAHASIRAIGSNALVVETDDGTTDNDDIATAVTLTAATMYEFMVDCTDKTDVKFYYRATLGGTWVQLAPYGPGGTAAIPTKFDMSVYTAGLQPYLQFQKSTGSQVTAMTIDFIGCRGKRS
jgi:hypothetical protein